jgi:hypothetical protein
MKTNLTMSSKPAEMVSGSKKLPLVPTITLTRVSCNHSEPMPAHRLGDKLAIDIGKGNGSSEKTPCSSAPKHYCQHKERCRGECLALTGTGMSDSQSPLTHPCYKKCTVVCTREMSERVGVRGRRWQCCSGTSVSILHRYVGSQHPGE